MNEQYDPQDPMDNEGYDPLDVTDEEQKQIDESKADFWTIRPNRDGHIPVISPEPDQDAGEVDVAFWNEIFGITKAGTGISQRTGNKQVIVEVVVVDATSPNAKKTDTLWFDFDPSDKEKLLRTKARFQSLLDATGTELLKSPETGRPNIEITANRALAGKKFEGLLAQGYQDRWDSTLRRAVPGEKEPFRRIVKYQKIRTK